MLKLYDYFDAMIEEKKNRQTSNKIKFTYFASDLMEMLDLENNDELNKAINRAFNVCESLNISLQTNFRKIYRYDGENLIADWEISSLACYIIIINCNPANRNVARAQLHFALNKPFINI